MDLEIKTQQSQGKLIVLALSGRLNALSSGALKTAIGDAIEAGHADVVLLMEEVSFVDSSGLSAIVSGLKRVREADGSLKLVGLNDNARRVFELTRLDRVFDLHDSLDEAL